MPLTKSICNDFCLTDECEVKKQCQCNCHDWFKVKRTVYQQGTIEAGSQNHSVQITSVLYNNSEFSENFNALSNRDRVEGFNRCVRSCSYKDNPKTKKEFYCKNMSDQDIANQGYDCKSRKSKGLSLKDGLLAAAGFGLILIGIWFLFPKNK